MKKILMINHGGEELLEEFFDPIRKVLLIPYAISDCAQKQKCQETFDELDKLGIHVESVPTSEAVNNVVLSQIINEAEALLILGGNTYRLLKTFYDKCILNVLKRKIEEGTPVVGKSAGMGVLCPTIQTTNDWQVVRTQSYDALGVIPFQINPHYPKSPRKEDLETVEDAGDFFRNEERESKIQEVLSTINRPVVGLRDGAYLKQEGDKLYLGGFNGARIFIKGKAPFDVNSGRNLSALLDTESVLYD